VFNSSLPCLLSLFSPSILSSFCDNKQSMEGAFEAKQTTTFSSPITNPPLPPSLPTPQNRRQQARPVRHGRERPRPGRVHLPRLLLPLLSFPPLLTLPPSLTTPQNRRQQTRPLRYGRQCPRPGRVHLPRLLPLPSFPHLLILLPPPLLF